MTKALLLLFIAFLIMHSWLDLFKSRRDSKVKYKGALQLEQEEEELSALRLELNETQDPNERRVLSRIIKNY